MSTTVVTAGNALNSSKPKTCL